MKILKEKKEALPVEFITSFVSKSWEEVGLLKTSIDQLQKEFKVAKRVTDQLQELSDAYLMVIGKLESLLEDKYIDFPETEEEENTLTESTQICVNLPDDVNPDQVEVTVCQDDCIDEGTEEVVEDEEEFDIGVPEIISTKADTTSSTRDNFEYFVDFEEPNLAQNKITDEELDKLFKA